MFKITDSFETRKKANLIQKKYREKKKQRERTLIDQALNTNFDLTTLNNRSSNNSTINSTQPFEIHDKNSIAEPRYEFTEPGNIIEECDESEDENKPDQVDFMYNGSLISVDDFIMSILALKIKHQLDTSTCDDLFKLFSITLPTPNACPKSSRVFDKISEPIVSQIYNLCSKCNKLSNSDNFKPCFCQDCNLQCDQFVTCDVKSQLNQILSSPLYLKQVIESNSKSRIDNKSMFDSVDGKLYKNAIRTIDKTHLCVSLNINTDGAPITTSTAHTLWPMLANIVELEPQCRESFKNLIFLGK
jgi:hypothetical protein